MAWVTPSNVATGDVLTASTWNQDVVANATELAPFFGAWTSYTPTIDQGASVNITNTIVHAKSVKVGRVVTAAFRINITGAGTAGAAFTVDLPYAAAAPVGVVIGHGFYFDASTVLRYAASLEVATSTSVNFTGDWSGPVAWGAAPNAAAANGDVVSGMVVYEAAS